MKDTLSRYWRKPDKQAAHTTALLRGSIKEYVESIPREQMAMRFARLEKGGKYTTGGVLGRNAAYSSMTYVRATIVRDSGGWG